MQRKSNNYRRKTARQLAVFLAICLFAGLCGHAQDGEAPYREYLAAIKGVLNNNTLSCRYKITMYDLSKKNAVDFMEGIILRHGKSYLDSNRVGITLSADGYVLRTEKKAAVANLYKSSSLEKKLGIKPTGMDNQLMTIPDSLLFKMGSFSIRREKGNTILKYVLKEKSSRIQEFYFTIRESDRAILSYRILNNDNSGYRKDLLVFDFENSFDTGRLSTSRYFKVAGGKAMLMPPYNGYKVNALL